MGYLESAGLRAWGWLWFKWGPPLINSIEILLNGDRMDMSLIDAMLWLGYGADTTHRPSENHLPFDEYKIVFNEIKRAHRGRELRIWGTLKGGSEYQKIDPSYWDTHDFSLRTIFWDEVSRFETEFKYSTPEDQRVIYANLMTNKARVKGLMIDYGKKLIRK